VRLEEESRNSKPRREERIYESRRKVREEPNVGVRSQITRLDFVVHRGPEERPGLQRRPVTIKAKVIEKFFSFREASASFQAERFFFCSG
jgi:hypothetical protein